MARHRHSISLRGAVSRRAIAVAMLCGAGWFAGGLVISSAAQAATAPPARAPAAAPPAAATAAGGRWLALIDAGQYELGWAQAADYLHQTVAKPAWIASVSRARKQLGALKSRRLDAAYATTYLPGAPYGHYVVMHYASAFAHRPRASETITCMEQSAGQWRVVGYYLN